MARKVKPILSAEQIVEGVKAVEALSADESFPYKQPTPALFEITKATLSHPKLIRDDNSAKCLTCTHYAPYYQPIISWGRCLRYINQFVPRIDGTSDEEMIPRVSDLYLCSEWEKKI